MEMLIGATGTNANEFDNRGSAGTVSTTRTEPNPLDLRDRGVLAKFLVRPAAGHKIGLTVEGREQNATVDVLRLPDLRKVTAMSGDDHVRRVRGSFEWEHKPQDGPYDRLLARVYRQKNETRNLNQQTRSNTSATCSASSGTGNNCSISQEFTFDQTNTGGSVQVERALGDAHLLTVGADLSRLYTEERRDGVVRNLTNGKVSKSLAGDTFPLRTFAPGYTDSVGLYFQDEIFGLAGGKLTLTPGLRYDWRKLKPEPDDLSQSVLAATGKQEVTQTDSAFSPKLAALWQFAPDLAGYGQVARGFRAPNYEEVNGHFRNVAQSYGTSPNPQLKPETSTSIEAGLRLNRGGLRGQVAVFDNHYQDFISSVRLVCPGDPNCIVGLKNTYMSVNLSKVRIYGAEARLSWDFAPGWRLEGALAHAHGTDESAGEPLDTVEPTRLTAALVRDAGAWGAEARLRAAAPVKRVNDWENDTTYSPWFRPPGYAVLNLGAWWRPSRQLRLSVVANNVFDKKYWLWSDIRIADARDPAGVDFYSQPGRNFAALLEYNF
ncbi:MAG: TonB-dependent receptor [Burkholderiales bacterium]|nr:TonB-dependent receptor [Burkholderiales bacterium]